MFIGVWRDFKCVLLILTYYPHKGKLPRWKNTGCWLNRPTKNRTYQKCCTPSRFFQKKVPLVADFWFKNAYLCRTEMSIVTNHCFSCFFSPLFGRNLSNCLAKSTEIPIFAVISEAFFLQKLVVEKHEFQILSFYTMLAGAWRDFWICPSDLNLLPPKRQTLCKWARKTLLSNTWISVL